MIEHFLKIADIKVIKGPGLLKTVVGSCIALCIWDRVEQTGGMVHIMMPQSRDGLSGSSGKYADTAVKALTDQLAARSSLKRNMAATIVGGASLFGSRLINSNYKPIGIANYEAVLAELRKHSIPVKKEDIGGNSGRRVVFDCTDGSVEITVLNKQNPATIREAVTQ